MSKPDMTSAEFLKSPLAKQMRGRATDYKTVLLDQIRDADLPLPEREVTFHAQRKWRLDFAWTEQKIALEYQGGVFDRAPSHSSVAGILRDYEKTTEAQLNGWIVLLVTPQSVVNGTALRYVKRALSLRANYANMGDRQTAKDVARTLRSAAEKLESG